MKTLENVDDFISKSRYSILVKKFGLPYVLNKWKKASEDMPFRKEYLIYEYLNNLCIRNVLKEILAYCDNLFKKKTVVVKESV
ncbi:hypothetical protein E4N83_05555 [Treponema denticola]|uniref:hypothetical protein n=1 Tax=Treponema denticola TaxID=158 RepID=UPI0020A274F5|nr:hypothetical protein [Treponema denticola]UTC97738.1 hypothetical protein E4N83_05555 [Treponema denticola]